MAYCKIIEKPLDEIVIFREATQAGLHADICHTRQAAYEDEFSNERAQDYGSSMPTDIDQEDSCFEDSTRYTICAAILILIATLFSKFVFLYLFISNGKTEAFAFVLDIVVFAYSVYHTPIYVPQSIFYNYGYELCFQKKISKARRSIAVFCQITQIRYLYTAVFAEVQKRQRLFLRVREILRWFYR